MPAIKVGWEWVDGEIFDPGSPYCRWNDVEGWTGWISARAENR